ncbi:MAG: oligosaccharide flippase family protein [Faecalibacterium sp.]|jgi:stage V sporulation protein B|nr:oligosaccharide flippase family protein [Faecalibacterium sp.]
MRQSYVKNAAILTASSLILRVAGMGFRIYLANLLGEQGVGLYELILAFYAVFITLATSGVSVASTRLFTEELSRRPAAAKGMARLLCGAAIGLGSLAAAVQWALADVAAQYWLGDIRAAGAIRAAAPSLPFMALAAVLRGFFLARRRVEPNVCSQLIEQAVRILLVVALLAQTEGQGLGTRCMVVLLGSSASEMISAAIMLAFYGGARGTAFGTGKGERPSNGPSRLWAILWPVEGSRCLSSGLHTAENMLVPACLALFLVDAGGRGTALAQYGVLKGMVMPLLFFPFGLMGTLATLLMPEITEAHVCGRHTQLMRLLNRMMTLTMFVSVLAGAVFCAWGKTLAILLYQSKEAGFYLCVLAPVMPMMYLESMLDGALKGLGEQKAGFGYTVWDSVFRIAGVIVLLPHFGMKGFLFVMLYSNTFTCLMNFRRLVQVTHIPVRVFGWFGAPCLAAVPAALLSLRAAGALGNAESWPGLILGCCIMGVAYFLLSWKLGLSEALQGLRKKQPDTR